MTCWILFILLQTSLCFAEPVTQVISASPSWDTFTNMDGTGLYHEILGGIFKPHGIPVIHKYTNAVRGLYMVQNDLAALYTCDNEISAFPNLALGQMILDRADFYIDDLNLIKESISKNKLPFDMNDYRIEPVGKRRYYPVFKMSERGKAIMDLYNKGIEQLHSSGELEKIFQKYNYPYPDYDIH